MRTVPRPLLGRRSVLAPVLALLFAAIVRPVEGQDVKAWQKRFLDGAKPTPAGVRLRVVVTESPVEADDPRALTETLRRLQQETGPTATEVRYPHAVSWQLRWDWEMEQHLSRCRFKDLTVQVDLRSDFATLAGPIAADSAARAWWAGRQERAFEDRLRALRSLRDAGRELYRELKNMEAMNCGDLGNRANEVGRRRTSEAYQRAREALWIRPDST